MITLELENEYAQEVFEILCKIPFEPALTYHTEPPEHRPPGIEQLIDQLQLRIEYIEDYDIHDQEE